MKLFIWAERLGDWEMHLTATKSTLNLFAANGHFNYAKSSRMYLQQMLKLPEKHPEVHKCSKKIDIIQHVAALGTGRDFGQIYYGTSYDEINKVERWFDKRKEFHQCVVIPEAMTSVRKSTLANSEQHVELGVSRKNRDVSDLSKNPSLVQGA